MQIDIQINRSIILIMAFLKFKKETPVLVGGCNDGTGTFSEPYLYQLHHEIGSSGEARTS
jgi:hypothetical protein